MARVGDRDWVVADGGPGDTGASQLQSVAEDLEQGRDGALEVVWELMADRLYGLALWRTGRREDAEDVVQEVFVRLARFPAKLRSARNPRAYLMRIAHNAAIDLVKGRRPNEPLDEATSFVVSEDRVEAGVDAANMSRHLAGLPSAQREALYLRFFAELSFREIGAVTGVSTFTAATRCRLAMGRLRSALGVEG